MQPTEFYKRVTALALYEHTRSPISTGFILSRVLKVDDLHEMRREIIPFVKETINRFWLVDGQLLESVCDDWYLVTADRTVHLKGKFLDEIGPDRAAQLFEAQHRFTERKKELA